ncbi:MAG TPA: o-succinylbenzoate synthase [Planctomycetota bacterium]|nr:o-succinylbenzoate synthase [Planctomycetota bacterium]
MRIERIELFHLKIPLVRPFVTSVARYVDREMLLVRVDSGGVSGWGEVPAPAAPLYSYETTQTAWHILRDFLAPKLRNQEFAGPGPVSELFSFVRGHNMAKAGLEMAVLDLFARAQGKPVHQVLGGERTEIPTGVSLGIEESVTHLLARVETALAQGYQRIKLKIKPKWDVNVLAEVRREFPKAALMADANSAYTLADIDHLKQLDAFDLTMIEQPLGYDDYVDHARLQARIRTPVCLDESIRSYDDARRAFELGACKVINIKQARVGGPYTAKMIHNLARARQAAVWCGGLLETGVGRAHNIALATLPHFTLPGDISASDRYYAEDVIDPPVTVTPRGTIVVPQGPGIGYTVVDRKVSLYCVRKEYVLS